MRKDLQITNAQATKISSMTIILAKPFLDWVLLIVCSNLANRLEIERDEERDFTVKYGESRATHQNIYIAVGRVGMDVEKRLMEKR